MNDFMFAYTVVQNASKKLNKDFGIGSKNDIRTSRRKRNTN